ncbi:MAG: glycosyltransferase family 4 protein [Candidatus Kapabacteria bacterium]|nr:glycosyltransferase family 4 protein [Candidatus Kapabacteria bacterium]
MKTKKKLRIAFISPKRYSFYPPDYLGRGLGGSESSLILMSRALAKRGHHIDVYNCCYRPGVYDGVNWLPLWQYQNDNYDVAISLRLLETFDQDIKAPIRGLWIHDETLKGATEADQRGLVNLWIAVSETQKKFIERKEFIDPEHWFVSRNGLDVAIYEELKNNSKIPGQVIYCSAPDRGLSFLLDYWSDIVSKVPFAKLIITGSWSLWGNADEENGRFFEELYQKAKSLPRVELLKRVSKKRLAQLQSQSQLMMYPTVFNEMFCISALECMAVGTPVISNSRAAMSERIVSGVDGVLISGEPGELKFREELIATTVALLRDEKSLGRLSVNAITSTLSSSHNDIAEEWEMEFINRLNKNI